MKSVDAFAIGSDFHLDTQPDVKYSDLPNLQTGNTVFLCAGDISPLNLYALWTPFVGGLAAQYAGLVCIPGNHEFYGGNLQTEPDFFYDNLKFLLRSSSTYLAYNTQFGQNSFRDSHGHWIEVFSTTLWTDFAKGLEAEKSALMMNDFRAIRHYGDTRRIRPDDVAELHEFQKKRLFDRVKESQADIKVVMTHHAPSYASVGLQFINSPINGAFVNNFDYELDDLGVDVWIHGHTHNKVDTTVANTRILCYPYGYPGEVKDRALARLRFDKDKQPHVEEFS